MPDQHIRWLPDEDYMEIPDDGLNNWLPQKRRKVGTEGEGQPRKSARFTEKEDRTEMESAAEQSYWMSYQSDLVDASKRAWGPGGNKANPNDPAAIKAAKKQMLKKVWPLGPREAAQQ